ncbi:RHS repeat-associated core domain-containing protein [Mucilaginibacter sp. UC70_90]
MAGRLKVADYRVQTSANNVVTPWSNSAQDYSVSNLYYDKNGNLTSMKQRGVKPGTGPVDMDVLSYHYQDNEQSNRLQYISDSGEPDFGAGDFNNGTTGNSTDYSYDPNGNLQSDLNKSISNATYTFFNKPSDVSFQSGKHVEFSYDAAGNKVQQITDPTGNALTTNYLGNVVYSGDKLQYALTSAGRTILDEQSTVPVKEEYFVKDHLGNVRSTIDVLTYDVKQYLATYELASANLEDLLFENIDNVRDDKPDITDPGDIQAARLNGGDPGHEVGTSLLLKVMAGDRVNMNVDNYYDGSYDSNQDNPLSAEDMLSNIISTLTGGVGGIPGEAHNVKLVDEVFTSYNYAALNDIVQNTATDPALPKAYLNYVLFDESMKIVPEFSGAYQANGNGGWVQIGSVTAKTIPANGYLAVYLSNNTHVDQCLHCGDVYFDKLKVEVSKGNLLEETHYYPHGLPISTLSSVSDNLKEQKRKYQSNEYITDLRLNWMDFQARQYDPQIGRFLSVDPLAAIGAQDMYSPYAAMGNAPESMIDPNGEQQTTFTSGGKELVDDNSGNDAHIGGAAKWLRNGGLAGSAASAGAGIGGGSWDPFHLVGSGFPALVQQAQIKQKVLQAWGSMLNPLGYTVDQLRSIKVTKTDDGFIVVGNLLPETVIKGKVSFGKRILSTIDNLAIAGDNWANKWFKGDDYGSRADKTYDADGGGIEFKGSDGQNQEGRKVGHPDDEAVNIDNMMFMFGNGGSGVSWTSFNERLEMISQGAEAITKFAEVTESLSDVMKPITEKPDTLIYDQRADGTVDFRSIPKDSLPYFRPAKFDVNGMYNSNNVLERK